MRGTVLVVDDELSMRDFLRIALGRAGYEVTVVDSPAAAWKEYGKRDFDIVVTDLNLAGHSGLDVLEGVKKARPETQVIVVTAFATPETAIAAMKRGAYDYLTKPFKVDEIGVVIERALEKRALVRDNLELRAELAGRFRLENIVGKSLPMQRVFELCRRVAPAKTSVLITGESGTGKELVARALHDLSPRKGRAFVAVNCGAIPEALLESELFGHVKGSFTGAHTDKDGLFTAADKGTLLLDEIGELPPQLQVKLLRVLQEQRVKPVGGTTETALDVRVLAATNRDLEAEVARGAFRRDLFYRLNVIELGLPPLRARKEDVPLLVDHFVKKHAAAMGRALFGVEPEALAALVDYDFPGNVRELENLVERAVTLETRDRVTRASLPELKPKTQQKGAAPGALPDDGLDLERTVADFERDLIQKALEKTGGVRKSAAKLLHISFRSLRYRLAKLGIDSGATDDEPQAE